MTDPTGGLLSPLITIGSDPAPPQPVDGQVSGLVHIAPFLDPATNLPQAGVPVNLLITGTSYELHLCADPALQHAIAQPLVTDENGRIPFGVWALPTNADVVINGAVVDQITVDPDPAQEANTMTFNPTSVSAATVAALQRNTASNIRSGVAAASNVAPGDFVEATVGSTPFTLTLVGSASNPGRAYIQYVSGTAVLTVAVAGTTLFTLTTIGQEQDVEWDGTSWTQV